MALIFCVSTVSAANTIYVNTTGNDSWTGNSSTHIDGTDIGPKATIQNGTDTVDPNGFVYVADGTYTEHITINQNLTLIGQSLAGTIIDGTQNGQPLTINPGLNVNITNFTITNGTITGTNPHGGGIYNSGTLTMTNCNIQNNTATATSTIGTLAYGGGIYNSGTLTMTNCNIQNNTATATSTNSPPTALGGGIYNTGGTLIMTNCNIQNNTATATSTGALPFARGGGIYNTGGTLTMTNCNIQNNKATATATITGAAAVALGGGIYNDHYGTLIMTNCNIQNNTATAISTIGPPTALGGGIYNGGTLIMTYCNIINNTASSTGTAATALGGGIINYGTLTVNYSRIVNNNPGAINNYAGTVNSLEDNWWGSNNPVFSNLLYNVPDSTHTNWLYLTVNATPSIIDNGATSLITTSFNNRCNGITVTPFVPTGNNHIPDGPVQLDIYSWGSFINPGTIQNIILNIVNGTANTTFYANGGQPTPSSVTINGTADGYTTVGAASAMLTINKVANLTITKTASDTVIAGTPINYTIIIENEGPDDAASVSFTDTFITGSSAFNSGTLHYRYKTNDAVNWIEGDWTDISNPLTLNIGTINIGKNATIQINGTINSSTTKGTVINNTARTNTTTTLGDKTASVETTVDTQANLNVTKTGPTSPIAGTQITYTITVKNNGPSDAQNVIVVDDIPGILQNVTHDPFNLGTIPAGESRTITINGTIPSSTTKGTIFQNNATVTSDTAGTITPSLLVTTTVDTLADVDINKTVDNPRPDVGDTVTFTVTAHNKGPSDALNIQIQDIMPSDFTDVVIIPSKGTYSDLTRIWTLNLTSGESATLNLTGKVTSVMAGKNTTNNVTLIGSTQKANATIYVPKANLYIQITSNNNPTVGETFTLRYKMGNYGPDDALNVTITIPIPDGFVISKIEGDGTWTIVGNNIIWTMNNVTVGDPDLYVSGWTKWAGSFQFGASILSDTFNLNSQGVSSFSLNAVPQVNAATTTTNTGKTVGMQTTGAPIVPLAFAVLSVLGGLVATRKKQ